MNLEDALPVFKNDCLGLLDDADKETGDLLSRRKDEYYAHLVDIVFSDRLRRYLLYLCYTWLGGKYHSKPEATHVRICASVFLQMQYLPQISGVASSTALLQRALREMGHLVYVITPSDPEQAENEMDVFRVPSLPFISSKRLSFGVPPVLARQIKALNFDIVHQSD